MLLLKGDNEMQNYTYPPYEQEPNPSAVSQLSLQGGNYVFPFDDSYMFKTPPPKQPTPALELESLESIIDTPEPESNDIVDVMMQDKLLILRSTTQLLRGLIDNRSQIKQDNIKGLDYKILQCGNYLLDLEMFPFFTNSMVEAKRANLGNAINSLESEKNGEITRCWSDQSRLYQELLTTLAEYRTAIRRSQLLSETSLQI